MRDTGMLADDYCKTCLPPSRRYLAKKIESLEAEAEQYEAEVLDLRVQLAAALGLEPRKDPAEAIANYLGGEYERKY